MKRSRPMAPAVTVKEELEVEVEEGTVLRAPDAPYVPRPRALQYRKRQRSTLEQQVALLDIMSRDRALALDLVTATLGRLTHQKRWAAVTAKLNTLGASKTSKQWHKVWGDMKSRTRQTLKARLHHPESVPPAGVSWWEEKVAAILSAEAPVKPCDPEVKTEAGARASRQRSSQAQLEALLRLVSQDTELVADSALDTLGRPVYNNRWAAIAVNLNCLGPSKRSKQWRKVWSDLKFRVKRAQRDPHRRFTHIEKRVEAIMNKANAERPPTGDAAVTNEKLLEELMEPANLDDKSDDEMETALETLSSVGAVRPGRGEGEGAAGAGPEGAASGTLDPLAGFACAAPSPGLSDDGMAENGDGDGDASRESGSSSEGESSAAEEAEPAAGGRGGGRSRRGRPSNDGIGPSGSTGLGILESFALLTSQQNEMHAQFAERLLRLEERRVAHDERRVAHDERRLRQETLRARSQRRLAARAHRLCGRTLALCEAVLARLRNE